MSFKYFAQGVNSRAPLKFDKVQDLADHLDVSRRTVFNWLKRGGSKNGTKVWKVYRGSGNDDEVVKDEIPPKIVEYLSLCVKCDPNDSERIKYIYEHLKDDFTKEQILNHACEFVRQYFEDDASTVPGSDSTDGYKYQKIFEKIPKDVERFLKIVLPGLNTDDAYEKALINLSEDELWKFVNDYYDVGKTDILKPYEINRERQAIVDRARAVIQDSSWREVFGLPYFKPNQSGGFYEPWMRLENQVNALVI